MGYSPWGRKESDMTERLHFNALETLYKTMTKMNCCHSTGKFRETLVLLEFKGSIGSINSNCLDRVSFVHSFRYLESCSASDFLSFSSSFLIACI